MRFNPLRGLTPDRLAQYLDQFDLGFFRLAAITWDRLERRDYKIKAVAAKRKKAVARHGWEIVTVDQVPVGQENLAAGQARALSYFYNNLTATDALRPDLQGGLALLVRQMMDAAGKYYAVHEIVWRPGREGLAAQFVFCPLWWFEGVTGKLRYLDNEFQVYGRDMNAGEWLVTCGDGLMEACSVAWMFKHLTLQDWLTLCEKWGQPFIDAATTSEPGSPEWDALVKYVENFGPDGGGVRSQGASITPIEIGNATSTLYEKMVENMDRALTILWRGGDLGTTSARNQTGASLQEEESEILETDDATIIEETLATQVSRYVIAWTFGPDAPVLAYLKFRKQEKQSIEMDLAIDTFLLNAGAPLAVKTTLERYGRPVPTPGEAMLSPSDGVHRRDAEAQSGGWPLPEKRDGRWERGENAPREGTRPTASGDRNGEHRTRGSRI
jgi:phage gp29-like protein